MVEFNFNINSIFPTEICMITNDLIPSGYNGEDNYALIKKKVIVAFVDPQPKILMLNV